MLLFRFKAGEGDELGPAVELEPADVLGPGSTDFFGGLSSFFTGLLDFFGGRSSFFGRGSLTFRGCFFDFLGDLEGDREVDERDGEEVRSEVLSCRFFFFFLGFCFFSPLLVVFAISVCSSSIGRSRSL